MNEADVDTLWYHPYLDVFLNRWFANYEEARQARESDGEFLLPYKRHFYVCKPEVISALGLDPEDPDWKKIKWDGAQLVDREANQRLCEKREQVVLQMIRCSRSCNSVCLMSCEQVHTGSTFSATNRMSPLTFMSIAIGCQQSFG